MTSLQLAYSWEEVKKSDGSKHWRFNEEEEEMEEKQEVIGKSTVRYVDSARACEKEKEREIEGEEQS